jgi:hypothetical protein
MLLSEIEDTVYVLDGGEVQLTPQFSTTAPSCPVTCGLYESDGRGAFLAYRRRRSAVPDILFNGKTGSISLWTEDRDLARKTVQFQVKCTASSNVPFGTFTDDFSVTFVEPGCNSEITSSAALSIEKRWGEGPGATSFEEYTFSTECDGDYSLRYRAKARQIINGIPQPYLADLPPEIAFDEASRTFAACKCNANCASGSPADDAECTSLAFTKQWEIKIIAELGDDDDVIAKNSAEAVTVTLSPDCSADTLTFTHPDFQAFTFRVGASRPIIRTPSFTQMVPQCPVKCELNEYVHMGSSYYPIPY